MLYVQSHIYYRSAIEKLSQTTFIFPTKQILNDKYTDFFIKTPEPFAIGRIQCYY